MRRRRRIVMRHPLQERSSDLVLVITFVAYFLLGNSTERKYSPARCALTTFSIRSGRHFAGLCAGLSALSNYSIVCVVNSTSSSR